MRLEAAPMDLPHLIESCLDLVRPSAHAKSLRLGLDFSPNAPTHIVADGTRLRQVLLNLLGNAVKFTQAGLIEIRVRLLSDAALRLEVADTGPGIPAERRHLLFQDFERLGDNPAVAEGAGLGLAISGRLVALMGGEFGYEENAGGGSVFWLRLPMAPAAATPRQAAGPAPDAHRGAALKILVADDMEMNRDVAEAFLVAAGHTVTCVEGGMEAVAAAAANDFDVVLMDVRMADLDGLAATRRIRALGGARGAVPIVALTAQAFVGEMEECLAAGMNSRLTKPYAPGALLEAVTQAASGRGSQPVAPAPMADEAADKVVDQAGFNRTCSYLRPGVITTYLDTIAERSRAVLAALRAPGAADGWLEDAAHTLAGSAGMFGFERMSRTASSFEFALKGKQCGSTAPRRQTRSRHPGDARGNQLPPAVKNAIRISETQRGENTPCGHGRGRRHLNAHRHPMKNAAQNGTASMSPVTMPRIDAISSTGSSWDQSISSKPPAAVSGARSIMTSSGETSRRPGRRRSTRSAWDASFSAAGTISYCVIVPAFVLRPSCKRNFLT